MKRPWWSRALALFVGAWFVAVSAAPDLTHACPMHGSHAAVAALGSSAHAGHTGAIPAASAAHHSAPSSESTPQRGTQCTCLGQCCGAAPVAVVSASIALADIVTVATRDAGLPDYAYVPVAAQHVLPFAHGPPLSA